MVTLTSYCREGYTWSLGADARTESGDSKDPSCSRPYADWGTRKLRGAEGAAVTTWRQERYTATWEDPAAERRDVLQHALGVTRV